MKLQILGTTFFLLMLAFGYAQQSSQRKGVAISKVRGTTPHYTYDDANLYEKREWKTGEDLLIPYRLLLPKDFDENRAYPLIVFLHGAGERGQDNEKQLLHGSKLFLRTDIRDQHQAIVVFPQCPEGQYWSNVEVRTDSSSQKRIFNFKKEGDPTQPLIGVMELIDQLSYEFKIKPDQRYVMGLSMGGMGTFELVRRRPGFFAAAIPICGGAHPETASQIKQTAFWIIHGAKDDVVPYQHSQAMVEALQGYYSAAEVRFTLYPEANHNSWDPAFAEPELLKWLFSQRLNP